MNCMNANFLGVMAGLAPAVHVLTAAREGVEVRGERGHDGDAFQEHRP
jgi:hypothetical protein